MGLCIETLYLEDNLAAWPIYVEHVYQITSTQGSGDIMEEGTERM